MPLAQIDELSQLEGSANEAKTLLANEATRLCHGEAYVSRLKRLLGTFSGVGLGDQLPQFSFSTADLAESVTLTSVMVTSWVASSNSAARRLIEQGSVKIDGEPFVMSAFATAAHFQASATLRLAVERRNSLLCIIR